MAHVISGEETSSRTDEAVQLKATAPDGTQYRIPRPVDGKYIVFPLRLDLEKDWALIQLIYSFPPRTRSYMLKDMLRIVVNAAHIWLEKQPMLRAKHGKKLTPEEQQKLLRTKLGLH